MSTIADNLSALAARIQRAAEAVGRDPASVHLLAVSKTKPASAIREIHAAGVRNVGENYLQEALGKQQARGDLPFDLALHRPHSVEQD